MVVNHGPIQTPTSHKILVLKRELVKQIEHFEIHKFLHTKVKKWVVGPAEFQSGIYFEWNLFTAVITSLHDHIKAGYHVSRFKVGMKPD